MPFEDLCTLSPVTLAAMKTAWTGRDPDYVTQIEAAETMVALSDDGPRPEPFLPDVLVVYRTEDGANCDHVIKTASGEDAGWVAVDWFTTHEDEYKVEQESILHTSWDESDDQIVWQTRHAGITRDADSDAWMVYETRRRPGNGVSVFGVVDDDLNIAAAGLSPAARSHLGLPEPYTPPGDVRAITASEMAELMREVAASNVPGQSDDARAEATSRGQKTPLLASNLAWLLAQAHERGDSVLGWVCRPTEWEGLGRMVREGEVPYEICEPVVARRANKSDATGAASLDGAGFVARGWVVVEVYDWRQTVRVDGQPDPDWQANWGEGAPETTENPTTAA